MIFVGGYDDALLLRVEAQHLLYYPRTAGQLLDQFTVLTVKIQMVVAVALTLKNEFPVVPRQKLDGVQRFYVFVVSLAIQFSQAVTRCRIIAHQSAVVLVAIELK